MFFAPGETVNDETVRKLIMDKILSNKERFFEVFSQHIEGDLGRAAAGKSLRRGSQFQ